MRLWVIKVSKTMIPPFVPKNFFVEKWGKWGVIRKLSTRKHDSDKNFAMFQWWVIKKWGKESPKRSKITSQKGKIQYPDLGGTPLNRPRWVRIWSQISCQDPVFGGNLNFFGKNWPKMAFFECLERRFCAHLGFRPRGTRFRWYFLFWSEWVIKKSLKRSKSLAPWKHLLYV